MLLPKRAAEEKRRGGERARARSGVEREERRRGWAPGKVAGSPTEMGSTTSTSVREREHGDGAIFRSTFSHVVVDAVGGNNGAGESPL